MYNRSQCGDVVRLSLYHYIIILYYTYISIYNVLRKTVKCTMDHDVEILYVYQYI